jgi:hypothetical protein
MLRKLMFPTVAFLALLLAVASTPKPAIAGDCDHQHCDQQTNECRPYANYNCSKVTPICHDNSCYP